ncbi:heterokaryon incompatibility protein-domain-containing protein [Podospora aff. communis PSN243]|uniref:Heterokaryon incompatibility protein-domain-containing protein n=1 Tax=Podospora aff. communis PSN243 TaxID=3040156 RepID=A0AAV9GDI2_9PEZI|nr:heterokaryon incompatibility protein-domain-containing protein [Podospora aff. communis PSN243]
MGQTNTKSSRTGAYTYRHLSSPTNQVRLVTILPHRGFRGSPIRCYIETVPLGSRDFEALSYVWGDQSHQNGIFVGNDKIFAVSDNLLAALQHLRKETEPRTLWIDAICINQADDWEKTYQVRLMRNIYFAASRVLVWLGESDSDMDEAIDDLVKNNGMTSAHLPSRRETGDALREGMRKIVMSPWWSRIWVVQEVIAAKADPLVMIGHKTMEFEVLRKGVMLAGMWDSGIFERLHAPSRGTRGLYSFTDATALVFFNTLMTAEKRGSFEPRHNMANLLATTVDRNATDERDHVFALLGLVEKKHLRFQADYTKPASWAFAHAMVAALESQQSLEWLLYAAGDNSTKTPGLPSWCVDFSAKAWPNAAEGQNWSANRWLTITDPREKLTSPTPSEFETPVGEEWRNHTGGASQGIPLTHIRHDADRGTITVRGVPVGKITKHHASTTGAFRQFREEKKAGTVSEEEARQAVLGGTLKIMGDTGICQIYAHRALTVRLGAAAADRELANGVIWKILSGGNTFNTLLRIVTTRDDGRAKNTTPTSKTPVPDALGYGCLEKTLQPGRTEMARGAWSALLPSLDEVTAQVPDFDRLSRHLVLLVAQLFGNKHFFATDTGYVGCAGHAVQEGDVVCVLFGCRMPAVLRPRADGCYTLVTFAHTHDVMEGQVVGGSAGTNYSEFTLR